MAKNKKKKSTKEVQKKYGNDIAPISNNKFTINAPEVKNKVESKETKKQKEKSNKLNKQAGYVAKKTGAGVVQGATGLVDAPVQYVQQGIQENKNKSVARKIIEPVLETLDIHGIYGAIKAAPKVAQIASDKNRTLGNKIINIAGEVLENNQVVRSLKGTGEQLSTIKGSEKSVKKVRDVINKPSEKLNEKLEKEGQNYGKVTNTIANAGQVVGNMIPSIAASIVTGGSGGTAAAQQVASLATMGISAKGTATREAERKGMSLDEANKVGYIKGLTEVATEKMYGGLGKLFGKGALDDVATQGLNRIIKNKGLNYVAKKGMDILGEWGEETVSDLVDTYIDKNTTDPDAKYSFEQWGETGMMTALSTIMLNGLMGGYTPNSYIQNATELEKSNQTSNVQKIIESELEERIENEYQGKATAREIADLQREVIEDIKNGYISTDKIERTLGGKTYNQLNELNKQQANIQNQIDELERKAKNNELESLEEKQKLEDLKKQIKQIDNAELKNQLTNEVQEIIKNDKGLQESYLENNRRKENFFVDLNTIQDETQRSIYQKAMDSGVLNNSNKTHALVDMIAKISAEKNINFDFTNNEQLENSGFGVNGRNINGYVTDSGITINLNSSKAINRIVGHELTHTFEGTTLYTELQDSLKDFLGSKWDNMVAEYKDLYKGVKNANIENELTSDLIGDYLFTDENYVRNLSTQHKNLFQKIYDEIKYLYNVATAGSKERRMLEKVKKTFDRIYNETESKTTSEEKMSLFKKKPKMEILDINEATDLNYSEQLKKEIQNKTRNNLKNENVYYMTPDVLYDMFDKAGAREVGYTDKYINYIRNNGMNKPITITADENGNLKIEDGNHRLYIAKKMGLNEVPVEFADVDNKIIKDFLIENGLEDVYNDSRSDINVKGNQETAIRNTSEYENKESGIEEPGNTRRTGEDAILPYKGTREQLLKSSNRQTSIATDVQDKGIHKTNEEGTGRKSNESNNEEVGNTSFSLSKDSQGRQLNENQKEYFKNSKVVDDNGNLKVMYNGGGDYTTFDNTKMSEQSKWGKGIYLTEEQDIARMYGDNVKEVYANIENPINQNEKTISFEKFNELSKALYDEEAYREEYDMYDNDLDLLWDITNKGNWADYGEQLRDIVGVDGLIIEDSNPAERMAIAFNSNQIKNVSNKAPTSNADIRYDLSVKEAKTTTDNNGRKLSKEQKEYFKDSVAVDNDGNLITVYHTTTNPVNQFNEFNPVGTEYYRFGDQVVNYYTDSKDMSGSYANQKYNMADTKKIKNIDEAKKWLEDNKFNGSVSYDYDLIPEGDKYRLKLYHYNSGYNTLNELYTENELLKNLKEVVNGTYGFNQRVQYEGYVNITNPYVVDAEARNWNQVISQSNDFIDMLDERLSQDSKNNLTRLYQESANKSAESRDDFNVLENAIRGMWNSPVDEDIKKVNEIVKRVGFNEIEDAINYDGKMGIMGVNGWYNIAEALEQQGIIGESTAKLIIDDFKLPDSIKEYIQENYNREIPLQMLWTTNASKLMDLLGKSTTLKDLYNTNQQKYLEFDKYRYPQTYFKEKYAEENSMYTDLDLEDMLGTRAETMGVDAVMDEIAQAASVGFSKPEMIRLWGTSKTTNDVVKEVIASNKDGTTNYDGVIIKNVYDYGGEAETQKSANDLYITFNSNQFKNIDNLNPTESDDIRYSLDRIPISKNLLTQAEQDELDGLRAVDNSGFSELTPEENRRMLELENRANTILNKKAEKMLRSGSYKAINTATKVAQNYLDFDAQEKKSFRNQLREFSNMTKDELIGADTYNKVKDLVSQYANKEVTYVDDSIDGIKRELKHTKIKITDELKDQITDYGDFVKDSRLLLRRNSGQTVDKVYQEYSQMYPGFFDSDVWNEADQLEALNTFMNNDFSVTEKFRIPDSDLKNATDIIYNKLLDNSLTQQDLIETEELLDKKAQRRTRTQVREELLEKMGITTDLISQGNDISAIGFARTDPVRVNEKVFGWKVGQIINDATVNFTKHQEAERMRFLNKERQEIKDLGIKARSKESELVQKYGEKQYVDKDNVVHEYGDAELNRDVKDVATRNKIKNAARVIRQKYDAYIDKANAVLTEMGYDEIPKRKDYMRHFVELNDKFSRWGLPFNKESMMAEDLPTDINGLTEFNRPGKSYFASANTRTGLQTTYDAITGIDGYLEGISNLIYHTESIQRYRALTRYIRENYGREHGLDNIDLMTDEELADRIKDIQDNKLSKYVSWLDEQANSIAGKKGSLDRSVERLFGRRIYTALNTLKSQVGSNMTGFNVRSAMTNFASAIQGASKTQKLAFVKGTISTINNIINNDGLIDKSDFLTRRFGSDPLSMKAWQKLSKAGHIFMEGTDYFTANQIWRSKYFENLQKGMSEQQAIKNADDFAARIMGDRSKGSTAELFNSKTLGFLSQFQLEVNNQWSSLIHDNKIDIQSGNKTPLAVTFQLGQLFAASYMFNTMMKALTGSDVMIDPIDMLLKIFKKDDDDDDSTIVERAQKVLGEFINNIPFANLVTGGGRIPISEAFTGVKTLGTKLMGGTDSYGNEIKWEDVGEDFKDSLAYWLLPTGYGQIRKTVKGLSMYDDKLPIAGSYTKSGNLRFSAEDTPFGKVKAGLFGQYSSKYAQDYIDSGYKSIKSTNLDEMKDLDMDSTEYRNYREGLTAAGKKRDDKLQYINSLDVSEKDKDIMGSNVVKKDIDMSEYGKYGTYKEFDYAQKHPYKHKVMDMVGGYDKYKEIQKEINDITADYDRKGNAISNSRKNKVIKYVNSLNLTRAQKAMLIKEQYPSFTKYDNEIASYVNNQNMSFIEKAGVLKQLGFKAYDKQIINYIKQNYRTVEEQQEELEKLGFKIYTYNGKTYVR